MYWLVMACAVACVVPTCIIPTGVLLAQTATDIQGNWVAKTDECGDLTLRITGQSSSGVITGTMECVRTGQARASASN